MELESKKEYARKFLEFMKDDKKIGVSIVKDDFEFKIFLKILVNKYEDGLKICIVCKERKDFNKIFNRSADDVLIGAEYGISKHKLYIYDLNTFNAEEIDDTYDIIIIDQFDSYKNKIGESILDKINKSKVEKTMIINYNNSKMPKSLSKLEVTIINLINEQGYLSNIIKSINKIRY